MFFYCFLVDNVYQTIYNTNLDIEKLYPKERSIHHDEIKRLPSNAR